MNLESKKLCVKCEHPPDCHNREGCLVPVKFMGYAGRCPCIRPFQEQKVMTGYEMMAFMRSLNASPKKLYSFADHHRHRAQLKKWNDKRGIAVALDCTPMDDEDKEICRAAVKGMYEAAGLVAPPPERIVFVSSPWVARLAGGFAAATWWLRENLDPDLAKMSDLVLRKATDWATDVATHNATDIDTQHATYRATRDATANATQDGTWDAKADSPNDATDIARIVATHSATLLAAYNSADNATDNATFIATQLAAYNATARATHRATHNATFIATDVATRIVASNATAIAMHLATDNAIQRAIGSGKIAGLPESERVLIRFFLECVNAASGVWQVGNEWAGRGSYISFFRDIAKLKLPEYANWKHWENLELHSGSRIVHKEFCIISDRPEFIKMDECNRPHCVDGPFKKYRDGWSLYSLHGVAVDRELTES